MIFLDNSRNIFLWLGWFWGNFGGDFLFGRPGGPKAPPRVDFSKQKRQKKHPFWMPKSRFLASFFFFFCLDFTWGFGRDFEGFGVPDGRKIHKKTLQNRWKKSIDFCMHLGTDFSWFFMLFGTSWKQKTSKNDGRGVIFLIFGICGSRSIPTCFLTIFGRIWGSKIDPKSWKSHAKMMVKKHLDFNMIF